MKLVVLLLALPLAHAADNGLALLPPMGWRSWNCFYADIDDQKIRAQVDGLVKPRDAAGRSFKSLGFDSVGIDEGWEGCKLGVNGTVHYLNGTPTVDPQRFPSMPDLVRYGHSKGVKMGFYLNGCGCNEKRELRINYEGDVRATVGWGFDSVKIDSCGAQKNMTLYGHLFNASGVPIQIEECHQGQNITDGGDPGQMGEGWCPFNFFRTSGDIVNLWDRVMSNLMTVVPFLSPKRRVGVSAAAATLADATPLSRPGCWAYPDMLEVGRMPEHNDAESRSHFAAWAVVSAPLVLGFDLSNESKAAAVWPIVSNEEVLEISQSWVEGADYPTGRLLRHWQAANVPTLVTRGGCSPHDCVDSNPKCPEWAKEDQCLLNPSYMRGNCRKSCGTCETGNYTGWTFSGDAHTAGALRLGDHCLDLSGQMPPAHGGTPNVLHTAPCDATSAAQKWTFPNASGGAIGHLGSAQSEKDGATSCLRITSTWLWATPVVNIKTGCDLKAPPRTDEEWTLHANGTLQNKAHGCVALSTDSGPPSTVWSKPLSRGRMALLAINGADQTQHMALDFADLLGPTAAALADESKATWHVRDVWARKDLGTLEGLTRDVPPHDCVLLVLSAKST